MSTRVLGFGAPRRRAAAIGAAAAFASLGLWSAASATTQASATSTVKAATATGACPWVNSTAPVAQRVEEVMAQMSEGDEIALVDGSGGTATGNGVGDTPAIPSLCIPDMQFEDGPAGVGDGSTGVTQMPAPTAAAATWDPGLEQQYGSVVGSEQASQGHDVDLGPTINIVRDPRWGRAFESMGEDPYLSGQMGSAYIQGVQSTGVLAQVKHFAVYNQESNRNNAADSDLVSQRAEQEIYLPAFQATVNAGVGSVMCAYSFPGGVPACQNSYLLQALNNEMGYQGFVTSDWGATHSTVAAMEAGLDNDQPGDPQYASGVYEAIPSQMPRAYLDDAVERMLTSMFNAGLFNAYPTGTGSNAAHQATATQIAEEGTVLLKNSGSLLPLNPNTVGSIAVIGTDASTSPASGGEGSAGVNPSSPVVTPLQGIQAAVGSGVGVTYNDGTNQSAAVAAAQAAKVAVIFVDYEESESWDLSSIDLGTADDNLISAVAAANPHTIVVLNTGSAVAMPWLSSVPSVLEQWYPGQTDGTAAAAILFGSANPSGHLPVTFPASLSQVPANTQSEFPGQGGQVDYSEGVDVGYRYYQANNETPLFPFGFGLSYTTFSYSNLAITGFNSSGVATVTAKVTNTGTVAGADVAQLYVGDPSSTGEAPWQLKGFNRVSLAPGASTTVSFNVPVHDLTYWAGPGATSDSPTWTGTDGGGWTAPAGTYKIGVGDSSASLPLQGSLTLASAVGPDTVTVTNPGNQTTATGATVNLAINATDSATGQALTYTATGLPGGLSINPSTGAITGTALHAGTVTVTVTATDGEAYEGSTSFTWTINGTNVGPTALPGSITGPGNLCVTDGDDSSAQGSPVTAATCNGSLAQVLTYGTDGTLQALGACIQAAGGATSSGTNLQLYPCNGSTAQVWSAKSNGELVNSASGLCVDDPGASTTSGTNLEAETCTGAAEQDWTITVGAPAGSQAFGPVIGDGELCLDILNAVNKPGDTIDAYTCNGSQSQQWLSTGNGELQAMGGCLDVTGGGTTAGSTIEYNTCTGSSTQTWTHNAQGEYVNQASGLCLDLPGGDTVAGAEQLDLQPCNDWPQEQWTTPGGTPSGPETTTTTPAVTTTLPTSTTSVPGSSCSATTSGETPLNESAFDATTNASSGTADAPENAITNAVNGADTTRFSTDEDQSPGLDYEVNMGALKSFNEIEMASPTSAGDYAVGYNVFVSANGTTWTPVASCSGNTGTPELASFPTQSAQYLEVVLTASSATTWWSVNQFYVLSNGTTATTTTTGVSTGTTTTTTGSNTGTSCTATASGAALSRTGWTATTNTAASGGDVAANAIDGNLTTRFSSDAGQAAGQSLTLNLGSAQSFDELALEAPNSAGDYARGYEVQVSSDGNTWTTVATCTGSGDPEIVSFPTQTDQYVQVVLTTGYSGSWWSVDEAYLYGPTTVSASCGASVSGTALSRSGWTATTNTAASGGDIAANAIDGNLTTRFSSDAGQAAGQSLTLNLGATQTFDELEMEVPNSAGDYARGYSIEVSANGSSWSTVATCTGTSDPEIVSFPTQNAHYVQVVLNTGYAGSWWSIDELYLYGSGGGTTTTTIPVTTSTTSPSTSTSTSTTSTSTTSTTVPVNATCGATIKGTQLNEATFVASTNAPSSSTDAAQNAITNAVEGNTSSRFSTDEFQASGLYFEVNLGSAQAFNEIDMDATSWPGDYARGYSVQVSTNGASWTTVATCTGSANPEVVSFGAVSDQYVRVILTTASNAAWWSIGEFKLY